MEIHIDTLIFSIINFCILLFILRHLLFKPIMASLEKRRIEISESLNNAEEARRRLDEFKLEQARELESVKIQAQSMRASIAKLAEEEKERIIGSAREEAVRLIEKAQSQLAEERERAIASLREEMAGLVIAASSHIIGRTLNQNDHERLVDDFLREVTN